MARVELGYVVVVSVPRADALEDRVANKWVRRGRQTLTYMRQWNGGLGHERDCET